MRDDDDRDSVTSEQPGDPKNVGKGVQRKGHDLKKDEHESGRHDKGPDDKSGRPTGTSTARDSTSVDPQDPIDPDSPNLIPS